MKSLASIYAFIGVAAAHGIVKSITIDGTYYPGYDPRYDQTWGQKRIEWGFSGKASAQGLGPVANLSSPDMACRFNPIKPPALMAVARAGSEVVYNWTSYFHNHKGPIMTYMGRLDSPTQNPTTVNFFKIHEVTYDPKTGLWANDVLVNNKMTWKVQIPSDIKAGDYILRHEITALHYATRPNAGPEFLISCANVKIVGDGQAVPKDTARFPGAYKADMPGLNYNIYHHENKYISAGPELYVGEHNAPQGPRPVVKDTGVGSGASWEAYKATKKAGDALHEGIVNKDDATNPGGGGCTWEPGADPSTAKCTPINGGHEMKKTGTNAYGQFNLKPPKPDFKWNPLEGTESPLLNKDAPKGAAKGGKSPAKAAKSQ